MALNSADIRGRGVRTRWKYDKDRNRRETQRQTDRQTERERERKTEREEEQGTGSVNGRSKKSRRAGTPQRCSRGRKGCRKVRTILLALLQLIAGEDGRASCITRGVCCIQRIRARWKGRGPTTVPGIGRRNKRTRRRNRGRQGERRHTHVHAHDGCL